jgi:hypothetical protein
MTFMLGTQVQFYCRTIDNVEVFSSLFSVETVPRFFSQLFFSSDRSEQTQQSNQRHENNLQPYSQASRNENCLTLLNVRG